MKLTIKELRETYELTAEEFGYLIGVTHQAVCSWESGKYKPRLENWRAIENEFGLEYKPEYINGDWVHYFVKKEDENN